MLNNNLPNSKRASLSGILVALAVLTVFLASVLPTGRLSLYVLSSFYVSIVIIELGVKSGWFFYIAACLLGFIAIPEKVALLPFVFFFGLYGIIKFYIEKLNKILLEYVLKIVFFDLCLTIAILFIREFLFSNIQVDLPFWIIISILQIIFVVYDYVYTRFIQYYEFKIRKVLKM